MTVRLDTPMSLPTLMSRPTRKAIRIPTAIRTSMPAIRTSMRRAERRARSGFTR